MNLSHTYVRTEPSAIRTVFGENRVSPSSFGRFDKYSCVDESEKYTFGGPGFVDVKTVFLSSSGQSAAAHTHSVVLLGEAFLFALH
jgi:hypothetical protein